MRERFAAILTLALVATSPAWAQGNEAGKAVYDKQCASCHGADGRGNASKAKVLKLDAAKLDLGRAEAAKLSRDEKKTIVVEGKGKMPAYGKKLKPEEIEAALNHAMALAGEGAGKSGAAPAEKGATATAPALAGAAPAAVDVKKAEPLWAKHCAGCHGVDGKGNAGKTKALKLAEGKLDLGRAEAAGNTREQNRKITAEGKAKMPAYAKKLSAAEIDLLTDHAMALAAKARGGK